MNLEEIWRRNCTVLALEALPLLYVYYMFRSFQRSMAMECSSFFTHCRLHLRCYTYIYIIVYIRNTWFTSLMIVQYLSLIMKTFKSTVHSFEEVWVAMHDWSKSILWCFGISLSSEKIISTNLNFWNLRDLFRCSGFIYTFMQRNYCIFVIFSVVCILTVMRM
jgi:hypothetical protein